MKTHRLPRTNRPAPAALTAGLSAWLVFSSLTIAADLPAPLPTLSQDPSTAAATEPAAPAAAPDKSAYNLFNPAPPSLMRELNPDRPDVTESPYTVDAGHYQLELSFLEFTHDGGSCIRTDGFSILPFNFKIGLLNNLDVQMLVNPYQNILQHGHGISQRSSGFGDLELRAKLNLWGNDDGPTAGGIMPFIKIPTGMDGLSNHHVEGGLILPLAVKLPWDFDLGTMAEFDYDRNNRNDGYGVDFVHTITLGHNLFDKLDAYLEYVGVSPMGTAHTYLAYLNTGLEYNLTENLQIDTGINIGLSGRADDFVIFTGLSFRH